MKPRFWIAALAAAGAFAVSPRLAAQTTPTDTGQATTPPAMTTPAMEGTPGGTRTPRMSRTRETTRSPGADTTRTPVPQRQSEVAIPGGRIARASNSAPSSSSQSSGQSSSQSEQTSAHSQTTPRTTSGETSHMNQNAEGQRPMTESVCSSEGWRKYDRPHFKDQKGCENWVRKNAKKHPSSRTSPSSGSNMSGLSTGSTSGSTGSTSGSSSSSTEDRRRMTPQVTPRPKP